MCNRLIRSNLLVTEGTFAEDPKMDVTILTLGASLELASDSSSFQT